MKLIAKLIVITGTLAGAILLTASLCVYYGVYDVSALAQHTGPVYRLLQYAMVRSANIRSRDIVVPNLEQFDWRGEGLVLYEEHCLQCHGAPGIAPESFSLGMMPGPTAIASIARERNPAHIYWIMENGIKMSGMPAWEYRLDDRQMWQIVALIKRIPTMTVDEYLLLRARANSERALAAASLEDGENRQPAKLAGDFDDKEELIEHGLNALRQYNCNSCHLIPGISSARSHVGPPLGGITHRAYIAGLLKNTDENLIRWIRFPDKFDQDTTMPDLGVTEYHARLMVAYFHAVDEDIEP